METSYTQHVVLVTQQKRCNGVSMLANSQLQWHILIGHYCCGVFGLCAIKKVVCAVFIVGQQFTEKKVVEEEEEATFKTYLAMAAHFNQVLPLWCVFDLQYV